MHRWFCSLRSAAAAPADPARRSADAPALLRLTAERFAEAAEECALQMLDLEPIEVEDQPGACWVVASGRLSWSRAVAGGGPSGETRVEEGGSLVFDPAATDRVRLRLVPELPTDCLRLGPEIVGALDAPGDIAAGPATVMDESGAMVEAEQVTATGGVAPGPESAEAMPNEAASEPVLAMSDVMSEAALAADAAMSEVAPAADDAMSEPVLATSDVRPKSALAADDAVGAAVPTPPARPSPDRVAEPCVAAGVPCDRRSETRVAISFHSRIVMLGLAGTSVAPLAGVLVNLTPHGACCRFRKAELRHVRGALENDIVNLRLVLPGAAEPLGLTAEVRWVDLEGSHPGAGGRRVGLEFQFVTERDRSMIRAFLERSAPDGDRSTSEPGLVKSLDGGRGSA